jgi:hypothetical protein
MNSSSSPSTSYSSSGELVLGSSEKYDPVEAYHQLRRYYLSNKNQKKSTQPAGISHYNSYQNGLYELNGGSHSYYNSGGGGLSPSSSLSSAIDGRHRCYVCLPPNKSSREARDILAMFPPHEQGKIADCSGFGQDNADGYEFNCPPQFGGCILRIHGKYME